MTNSYRLRYSVLVNIIEKKDEFAIIKMNSFDVVQAAINMSDIGDNLLNGNIDILDQATSAIQINDRSFEIIEQPSPTVNKFRFVSELLNKNDKDKPLNEKLQLITKKNDGTIYGQSGGRSLQKIRIHSGGYRVRQY